MLSFLIAMTAAAPLDNFVVRDDIGPNKIPHLGTSHILVIPVVATATWDPQLVQMQDTYAEDGWFREHWLTESNGLYDPIPTVVDPVVIECPFESAGPLCEIDPTNFQLLFGDQLQDVFEGVLRTLRDEQGIDLAHFDVNGMDGEPDGYFDGVVIHTSLASGVAFPLVSFNQEASVGILGDDDENTLTVGMPALSPPELHEFAHAFGFIDHYGGPGPEGLMDQGQSEHFSAYNRSLLDWSEVFDVTVPIELTLGPTTEGGRILKLGDGEQFLMLANRDGAVVVTSIDEEALPVGELGFIDVAEQDLYLPNRDEPWLNRLVLEHNNPLSDLAQRGDVMRLAHASDGDTGWTVRVLGVTDDWVRLVLEDGTATVQLVEPEPEGFEVRACGCDQTSGPSSLVGLFGLLFAFRRRRRLRSQQKSDFTR